MKRAHLIIALCLVFAAYALAVHDAPEVTTPRTLLSDELEPESSGDVQVGSVMPDLELALPASQGARAAVPVSDQEPAVAEDPCASVQDELEAARTANEEQWREIAQLKRLLSDAVYERDLLKYGEDTPYGAFLASYEGKTIDDAYARERIEDWLRQFPVFLRPGEATWIAERVINHDSGLYGRTSEVALILYLGPDRLAAELPEARMAELREYYADEEIFSPPVLNR